MSRNNDLMRYQAREIERTLAAKKLRVKVVGGYMGHRLIVYRLVKPPSVDLRAIQRQEEELALALQASSCRVGRRGGHLTVEIPRRDPVPVRLTKLVDDLPERRPGTPLVGVDEEDVPLLLPLGSPNVGHVLIAGTTGSGKTILARAMIAHLARGSAVYRLGLILLDPKCRGYLPFAGLPHLVYPIVTEPDEARAVLAWAVAEMERRDREGQSSPRLVVFIDELADLMLVAEEEIEASLTRLVQRGREAGIHIVACTQKPTASVIGSLIKANFPVRIVGKVTDTNDAYVATGIKGTGAESLLGKGDFLAVVGGEVVRLQAPYISETEIEDLVTRLRGGRPLNSQIKATGNGDVIDFVERYRERQETGTESPDNLQAAIAADHEAGLSQRELEKKYFGFTGGSAYSQVKEAIESATTTEGAGR